MLLLHTFSLLPRFVSQVQNLQLWLPTRGDRAVSLAPGATTGTLLTPAFDATRRRIFEGFQIFPSEAGIAIALVDPLGQQFSYDGATWVPGGFSTPDQIRAGLPTWSNPVCFRVQLTRLPDGRSPLPTHILVGYRASGNLVSYLLNFGIPRFLDAEPITLYRTQSPPDRLNPARVLDTEVFTHGGRSQVEAHYKPPCIPLQSAQIVPIEETPVFHLRLMGTDNKLRLNISPYVRSGPSTAKVIEYPYCEDVRLELAAIAQTMEDCQCLMESALARITRIGKIECPPFGVAIACVTDGEIRYDGGQWPLDTGALPMAIADLRLLSVPVGGVVTDEAIATELEIV